MVAISWLGAAFGLLASNPEAAGAFSFVVMFLPYLSSAFVPPETMPAGLQAIAEHQPITPITETVRALLMGGPGGDAAGRARLVRGRDRRRCGGGGALFRSRSEGRP